MPKDLGLWLGFLGKGDDVDRLRLNTLECFAEVVMIGISLAMAELTKILTSAMQRVVDVR